MICFVIVRWFQWWPNGGQLVVPLLSQGLMDDLIINFVIVF